MGEQQKGELASLAVSYGMLVAGNTGCDKRKQRQALDREFGINSALHYTK